MKSANHSAGAPNKTEEIIADVVYRALRRSDHRALIIGEPGHDDVLLDGNFNFQVIARFVRRELERLHLLVK